MNITKVLTTVALSFGLVAGIAGTSGVASASTRPTVIYTSHYAFRGAHVQPHGWLALITGDG